MATLAVSPANGQLWRAPYVLTGRVDGVNFATPNKTLAVVSGQLPLYSWTDNVIFTQQGITQETVVGPDYLLVTLTFLDAPTPGTGMNFDVTYSDDATPQISASTQVCAGNVFVLGRNPAPDQLDVPVIAPLVLAVSTDPGLTFAGSTLYIDGVRANNPLTGEFLRPDFVGISNNVSGVLFLKVMPRRAYNEGHPVAVRWELIVTPDFERKYLAVLEWTFQTAHRVTPLLSPALQRTALNQPSPIGIIELFRQTALDALVPPRSSAATAVVFYYAVQQSSLASLAPVLPNAPALAAETVRLLADDIASPVEAAAKLAAVSIFWTSLLQILIRDVRLSPQLTELLDRAWNSEYPADRGGAVAAALLYAVHAPI